MTRRTRQHGQFGFAGATALLTLAFTGARLAASPAPQAEAETPHIQVDDRVDYGGAIAVFDVYYSSEDIDAEEATSGVIVATNSTHRDRFTLYTHARIDGDVYVGVGGDPDNVIATWSGSEITGEQRVLEEALDLAAVSMPEGAPFDSPSEGHFSLWGSMTETIDSDRHFHHFQLSGTSRVTIEGDVTLVVDGNFQVTTFATVDLAPGATLRLYLGQHASLGGDVNDGGYPDNLHVYMCGNNNTFLTYGFSDVRAVVHNPTGYVQLWSVRPFFGLIQANRLQGCSPIHADLDAAFELAAPAFERFQDISGDLGISAVTTNSTDNASGWHWGDLNNDGYLDAVATGTSARRFLNVGGVSFTTGSLGQARRQGALADFDHDGDLDFWCTVTSSYNDEAWFENPGNGALAIVDDAEFYPPNNNEGCAAADVNGDGWCDVVMFSESGNYIGHLTDADPLTFAPTSAESYGLHVPGGYGNGEFCSSADVNGDGYLDFFYHHADGRLFLSDGDGTYTWNNSGISVVCGDSDKAGSAWADYDNDGDLDIYICRLDDNQQGYLWRNDGGAFALANSSAGVTDDSIQRGCAWGDCDNDGDLDLAIATNGGGVKLYLNQGDGTFTLDDAFASVSGDCQDVCFVDFDNDGDLDLAVTRTNASPVMFENQTDNAAALAVRVIGAGERATNLAGIGVRVELLTADGSTLLGQRHLGVARGFAGATPLWAHFGGVDTAGSYLVRAYFRTGIVAATVTPAAVSTTIGGNVIPQLLTLTEPPPPALDTQIIEWSEVER